MYEVHFIFASWNKQIIKTKFGTHVYQIAIENSMKDLTYQIFDVSGTILKIGELVSTKERIALSQGLYVVVLTDDEKSCNVKVIVK